MKENINIIQEYMRVFYIKYPLQENFIYKIRCWIKYPQEDIHQLTDEMNDFLVNEYFCSNGIYPSTEILMDNTINQFSEVLAAIEITDSQGNGTTSYLDWP